MVRHSGKRSCISIVVELPRFSTKSTQSLTREKARARGPLVLLSTLRSRCRANPSCALVSQGNHASPSTWTSATTRAFPSLALLPRQGQSAHQALGMQVVQGRQAASSGRPGHRPARLPPLRPTPRPWVALCPHSSSGPRPGSDPCLRGTPMPDMSQSDAIRGKNHIMSRLSQSSPPFLHREKTRSGHAWRRRGRENGQVRPREPARRGRVWHWNASAPDRTLRHHCDEPITRARPRSDRERAGEGTRALCPSAGK